jgi:hypothetical protein
MKVEEVVYQSLRDHPTLYKRLTYEEARRDVLHHYFIVLGSGIEWAWTKVPEEGGYLTEHEFYKTKKNEDGYALQKYNKPYHKSGIVIDQEYLDKFFSQKLYYVWGKGEYGIPNSRQEHPNVWEEDLHTVDLNRWIVHDVAARDYPWQPYPNFKQTYSPFWEDGCKYIQEDWRLAAIEHLEFCKDWFNTPENLIAAAGTYTSYFNTAETIERSLRENEGKRGFLQREDYQRKYGWYGGDYSVLAELMNESYREECVEFIDETVDKLEGLKNA